MLVVLRLSALAFLDAMALILVYLALAGRLRLRRLVMQAGARSVSLARAQLLAVMGLTALVLPRLAAAALQPPLTQGVLLVVAISNLIYLWETLRRLRADLSRAGTF